MRIQHLAALATIACLATPVLASTAHYVPGIEGVKASAVPPPGVYYKGYYVNYTSDKFEDGPPNSEVTVNALAHRFIWVTEQQLVGGNLTLEAILPMVNTDLTLADGNLVDDKSTGVGDVYLGGVIGWHGEGWDAVGGLGYWADTGKSGQPADPGKDHAAFMLTLGGNWQLNKAGDITFSLLGRYELPTDSKYENELFLEWGLGKSYGTLDVGIIGYNTFQAGRDGAERTALGLSVGSFWPNLGLGADLAAYQEIANKHWFEGRVVRASLTKVF